MADKRSIITDTDSSLYFTPRRLDSSRSSDTESYYTARRDIEANEEENFFKFNEEPEPVVPVLEFDSSQILSLARHNKVSEVEGFLKQGFYVDSKDEFGNTILLVACQNGHMRILKLALRYGANINCQNNKGNCGLHFSFAYGYEGSIAAYLLSKGANDRLRNYKQKTCYDPNPIN